MGEDNPLRNFLKGREKGQKARPTEEHAESSVKLDIVSHAI